MIFSTLQLHLHPDLLRDPTLDQINLWLEAISGAESRQLTRAFLVWTQPEERGPLLQAALPHWTRVTDGEPIRNVEPYPCSAACARGIEEALNLIPAEVFNRDVFPILDRLQARIRQG